MTAVHQTNARELTPGQLTAIHTAMALFVEDDLAQGVPPWEVEYCPACDGPRPLPGFVLYDQASAYAFVCNACATEYEVERMRGVVPDIRGFLRGKTRGDTAGAQPAPGAAGPRRSSDHAVPAHRWQPWGWSASTRFKEV